MRGEYFTPDELAEHLGVSARTLTNWRGQGVGPTYERFGNKIRYFQDQVVAWRDRHRHASTQEYGRAAMKTKETIGAPSRAELRSGVIDQIVTLVRQLDALENMADGPVGPEQNTKPIKRPRRRPRKSH